MSLQQTPSQNPPPNAPTDPFVGNIFGYISVSIQIIYYLPILILFYRSKSNPNPNPNRLSYTFLILEISGATSSLIYGCLINQTPLLLSNAINLFLIVLILITKSFNIQNCINQSCINYFSSGQNHRTYRRPNNIIYSINETENNSPLLYDRSSPIATSIPRSPEVPHYDTLSKSVPIKIPNKNKKYWNPNKYTRNNLDFENKILREIENKQSKSAPQPRLVFEPFDETPTPSPELLTRTPTPMPSPMPKLISPTNPSNLLNKNIDEIIENNFNFNNNNPPNVYPPDPENLDQYPE